MKRSREDIPGGGRTAEPRSGQEGKPTACLGCRESLHAWATHPCLGHARREEKKEQRTWLWTSRQGKEEKVALQDQDRLASSQAHPGLTLGYHHGNHWGGLPGVRRLSGSCSNPRRSWFCAYQPGRGADKFGPELPCPGWGGGRSRCVRKLCWTLVMLPMSECETNKRQLKETNYYLKEFSTDAFKTQLWKTGFNIYSNKTCVEWQPSPTQLIKEVRWDTHV